MFIHKKANMFPYIGITGFTKRSDVEACLNELPIRNSDEAYKLMVGVLVSHKTLRGLPNKWPQRYPEPKDISDIFVDDPRAFNLIHYNTKNMLTLPMELIQIEELAGPNLHGFQLNICWPGLHQLKLFKRYCPNLKIILQVGYRALEEVELKPLHLAKKISEYTGLVEYVLLDPSGGLGKSFHHEAMEQYIKFIKKEVGDQIKIGLAGGLAADTLKRQVTPLAKKFPGLSIDAERKLRDKNDNLDPAKAMAYIRKASKILIPKSSH